ncbi:MAG: heme A synthase [Gammaproteobacteria bacterium]|nr:MAG: heme A synthase [Gammaproteobacteria bacterium]
MADPASRNHLRRFAGLTVLIIYMLILVGGTVRATGAGMGCPDWPTCFGQWIPPTSEAQLPVDYQTIYADRGYADTTFNVRKTWTEYVNRLLGVFTGFSIFLTLLFAIPCRHTDRRTLVLSALAFVLVGVQGWLGARVVASNLMPGMITLHMLLAQIIVALLIAVWVRAGRRELRHSDVADLPRTLFLLMLLAMVVGLLQLLTGTQVREAVDIIARQSNHEDRHLWIDNLPLVFAFHKWFALPVALINAWLIVAIYRHARSRLLRRLNTTLLVLILGTIVLGLTMDSLHLPIVSQPLHLLFASMIFGTQFAILLVVLHAWQSGDAGRPSSASDRAAMGVPV